MEKRKTRIVPGLGKLVPYPLGRGWNAIPEEIRPEHRVNNFADPIPPPKSFCETIASGMKWLRAYQNGRVYWEKHPTSGGRWVIKAEHSVFDEWRVFVEYTRELILGNRVAFQECNINGRAITPGRDLDIPVIEVSLATVPWGITYVPKKVAGVLPQQALLRYFLWNKGILSLGIAAHTEIKFREAIPKCSFDKEAQEFLLQARWEDIHPILLDYLPKISRDAMPDFGLTTGRAIAALSQWNHVDKEGTPQFGVFFS